MWFLQACCGQLFTVENHNQLVLQNINKFYVIYLYLNASLIYFKLKDAKFVCHMLVP